MVNCSSYEICNATDIIHLQVKKTENSKQTSYKKLNSLQTFIDRLLATYLVKYGEPKIHINTLQVRSLE